MVNVGTSELPTLLEIEQDCWKLGRSLLSSSRHCKPVLPGAGQLLARIYSKCNRPSVWSNSFTCNISVLVPQNGQDCEGLVPSGLIP